MAAFLTLRFEQLGAALMHAPVSLIISALVLPIVLTALARQPIAFLSVALLVAAILAIDVTSASAGVLVAIQSYVASILIGALALRSSRQNRTIKAELANLRADVEQLRRTEERRFVMGLNTQTADSGLEPEDQTVVSLQPRGSDHHDRAQERLARALQGVKQDGSRNKI
jgi:hypothetical protein